MDKIIEMLFYKLSHKGLQPLQIPGLVRNVLNIVIDGNNMTMEEVNQKLRYLGWGEEVIDGSILELIVHLFENGREPEIVESPILH